MESASAHARAAASSSVAWRVSIRTEPIANLAFANFLSEWPDVRGHLELR